MAEGRAVIGDPGDAGKSDNNHEVTPTFKRRTDLTIILPEDLHEHNYSNHRLVPAHHGHNHHTHHEHNHTHNHANQEDSDSDSVEEGMTLLTPRVSPCHDHHGHDNHKFPEWSTNKTCNKKDIGDGSSPLLVDKEFYLDYLRRRSDNHQKLKKELHDVVRNNCANKLQILCEFFKDKGVCICSEDMLGNKNKETVLCQAIVLGYKECAKILITFGGAELVKRAYSSKKYEGATALHLAILKQDDSSIGDMLAVMSEDDKSNFLHGEATGEYFDQHYNFACLPLALAAGLGSIKIFNLLVRHGADLWHADERTGNTIMHSVAAIAEPFPERAISMLREILNSADVHHWWETKSEQLSENNKFICLSHALLKAENKDGHTPFTYAACLGAIEFASVVIEEEKLYAFPQWDIGPNSYTLYEMSEIETAIPTEQLPPPPNPVKRGINDKVRAMEIFSFVLNDENLNFGDIPILKHAMLCKWEAFKKWFYGWGVVHLLVMALFTVCLEYRVIRTSEQDKNIDEVEVHVRAGTLFHDATEKQTFDVLMEAPSCGKDVVILVFECIVLFYAAFILFLEVVDVISSLNKKHWKSRSYRTAEQSIIRYQLTLRFDSIRFFLTTFSTSVIVVLGLRFAKVGGQDFGYAFGAFFGWMAMFFFTRAFKNIGIFTVMLQRMISRELVYFTLVFIFAMLACGTATYALFQESPDHPDEVSTIPTSLFSHFRLLVGLEELAIAEDSRLPWLVKVIFMIFVLLANILLLNMLIAAMNNTYVMLDSMKELLWLRMRTRAVLMIERRLPICLRPPNKLDSLGKKQMWFLASEKVHADNPLAEDD